MSDSKVNTGELINNLSSTGHKNQATLASQLSAAFANPTEIDFFVHDSANRNFLMLAIENGRGKDITSMLTRDDFTKITASENFTNALLQLDADGCSCLHYALLKKDQQLALKLLELCPALATHGTAEFSALNLAEFGNFTDVIDKIGEARKTIASQELISLLRETSEARKAPLRAITKEFIATHAEAIVTTSSFTSAAYSDTSEPNHYSCLHYAIASAGLAIGKQREKEEKSIIDLVGLAAASGMFETLKKSNEVSPLDLAKQAGLGLEVLSLLSEENPLGKFDYSTGAPHYKKSSSQRLPALAVEASHESSTELKEKVKNLLDQGANLEIRDAHHRNAFSYAAEEGLTDIAQELTKHDPENKALIVALPYGNRDFMDWVEKDRPHIYKAYSSKITNQQVLEH